MPKDLLDKRGSLHFFSSDSPSEIDDQANLQPYWRDLERRVSGRKPRTTGPSGRENVRRSEVDYWMEAGVYDGNDTTKAPTEELTSGPPFARLSRVSVSPDNVTEFQQMYKNVVRPVLQASPGFQRASILHEPSTGQMLSISMWRDEASALAVSREDAYQNAMGNLQRFMDGVPTVAEVDIIVDVDNNTGT
eukprot:CAMPEP_0185767930 /NCGR_PEP_ID=MMETSP1174-20130828/45808_1 /TAXON_ID=35687 /ORGANISM="Dictyocha speculum, Strain CCMP1381" /LENGTH=190 /DNA_ID=CAMNT_0028452325 /DNA_START=87 /DNA_END=659 /DNA_ORIENTATION=+